MPAWTYNGIPILRGNASIPRCGLWTADFLLEASDGTVPAVGTTAALQIGTISRTGTVVRAGAPYLQSRVRLVGGAGKLGTMLDPRDYRGYGADQVFADILRDAGENIGPTSPLANLTLSHWTRVGESAARALHRLLRAADPSLTWRCGWDGSIGVYQDTTWPTSGTGNEVESYLPTEDLARCAPDDGDIDPGTSINLYGTLRHVDRVTYLMEPDSLRAMCHLAP